MRTPSILFVLADGAHARLVERREDGAFVTVGQVDGRPRLKRLRAELKASPRPWCRQSAAAERHVLGRGDPVRDAKAAR